MNLAIVCDWLTNLGGAEKVIHALHVRYPKAPIFTTLYDARRAVDFKNADVRTTDLQKIPFANKAHQLFLSMMPLAIESINVNDYDVVISSSHAVANGIITKPSTLHISYCHTPMRYAWEHWELEHRLSKVPKILHGLIKKRIHSLRTWDRLAAERVDAWLCNSTYVQQRIWKYYRKRATVLHPPVDITQWHVSEPKDDYLMAGRLIGYKRFDLVIQAFNKLTLPLIIAGDGPEYRSLKTMSKSNITFVGRIPTPQLANLYSECQALIFPQLEDFGIIPLECMASGRPVLAYGKGGALDSIVDGKTGLLFASQTVADVINTVKKHQQHTWNPKAIRAHAETFSLHSFHEKLETFIKQAMDIKR